MSSLRYLDAEKVTLPSRAPQFVEPGHCQWCNKELTGRAKYYCRPIPESIYSNSSDCAWNFLDWWCLRPAYVRATFIKDNFTCQNCGYHKMQESRPWLPDLSNLECDHIIPLARGGKTEMGNLQTLCKSCNRKKGTDIPGEEKEKIVRVILSRDNSKCPECGAHGYLIIPWLPFEGFDPTMKKVRCTKCGTESFIGPKPSYKPKWKINQEVLNQ